MVWCGSTEVFMTEVAGAPVARGVREGRSRRATTAIPSSMVYAYAAISEGIPYANAAPNLTRRHPGAARARGADQARRSPART